MMQEQPLQLDQKPYGYVYKITNLVNGKIYVGQTTGTLEFRFRHHFHTAKNSSREYPFVRALRKYGKDSFSIEEICGCSTLKQLNDMESYWISELKAVDKKFGYNSRKAADGRGTMGEEQRLKIISSKLAKSRPVEQYDRVGNKIATYISMSEASKTTGISGSTIRVICSRTVSKMSTRTKTSRGFTFFFRGDYSDEELRFRFSPRKTTGKRVVQIDGIKEVEYRSASEAANKLGCSHAAISKAAKAGGYSQGYWWRYKEDATIIDINRKSGHPSNLKEVEQYDRSGSLIATYRCARHAEKVLGLKGSHVSRVCANKPQSRTCGGWAFFYAGDFSQEKLDDRFKPNIPPQQNNKRAIIKVDDLNETEYSSLMEAARDVGLAVSSIKKAANKGYRSKGFFWRYK